MEYWRPHESAGEAMEKPAGSMLFDDDRKCSIITSPAGTSLQPGTVADTRWSQTSSRHQTYGHNMPTFSTTLSPYYYKMAKQGWGTKNTRAVTGMSAANRARKRWRRATYRVWAKIVMKASEKRDCTDRQRRVKDDEISSHHNQHNDCSSYQRTETFSGIEINLFIPPVVVLHSSDIRENVDRPMKWFGVDRTKLSELNSQGIDISQMYEMESEGSMRSRSASPPHSHVHSPLSAYDASENETTLQPPSSLQRCTSLPSVLSNDAPTRSSRSTFTPANKEILVASMGKETQPGGSLLLPLSNDISGHDNDIVQNKVHPERYNRRLMSKRQQVTPNKLRYPKQAVFSQCISARITDTSQREMNGIPAITLRAPTPRQEDVDTNNTSSISGNTQQETDTIKSPSMAAIAGLVMYLKFCVEDIMHDTADHLSKMEPSGSGHQRATPRQRPEQDTASAGMSAAAQTATLMAYDDLLVDVFTTIKPSYGKVFKKAPFKEIGKLITTHIESKNIKSDGKDSTSDKLILPKIEEAIKLLNDMKLSKETTYRMMSSVERYNIKRFAKQFRQLRKGWTSLF